MSYELASDHFGNNGFGGWDLAYKNKNLFGHKLHAYICRYMYTLKVQTDLLITVQHWHAYMYEALKISEPVESLSFCNRDGCGTSEALFQGWWRSCCSM
jgi:hypothetical protein